MSKYIPKYKAGDSIVIRKDLNDSEINVVCEMEAFRGKTLVIKKASSTEGDDEYNCYSIEGSPWSWGDTMIDHIATQILNNVGYEIY